MPYTLDPITLGYLGELVRKTSTEYPKVSRELYQMAAPGFGYGTTKQAAFQIMRVPLMEHVLPEVTNKDDPSPEVTHPEPLPLTVTARTHRARYSVYWEDDQDDAWGFYEAQIRAFGESIGRTEVILAHDLFVNALNPSRPSGWDNLPLGHTAHLLEGGGAYDNTLPAQPPSESLMEQVDDYFSRIPSAFGNPQPVDRIFAIVGSKAYYNRWKQILGADTAIAHPFNPADDPNQNPAMPPLIAGNWTIIYAPYLVHRDWQFFIGAGHELFFKVRWQYQDEEVIKDPRKTIYYAGLRVMYGWGDARRVLVVAT